MAGNPRQQLPEKSGKSVPTQSGKVRSCTTCVNPAPGKATLALQRANVDPRSLRAGDILQLQRTMGNQAVAQMFGDIAQRQSPEEEELMQGKFERVQRQEAGSVGRRSSSANVLDQMGGVFNADFSNVTIHADSTKAANVGALAYTQGTDIHFAPGQYRPETSAGQKLLGHELTHVVQQSEGRVLPTGEIGGMSLNDNPALEHEAERQGDRARNLYAQIEKPQENKNSAVVQGRKLKKCGVGAANNRSVVCSQKMSRYRFENKGVSSIVQLDKDINLDKVKATANEDEVKKNMERLEDKENLQSEMLSTPSPGYMGMGIVYSKEENAVNLAKKYVEGSQDWIPKERKARLGVNFGINKYADFDKVANDEIVQDVKKTAVQSFDSTKDLVSTKSTGFTWGFSYEKGGLGGKITTEEMRNVFETNKLRGEEVHWKQGGDEVDRLVALGKFRKLRDGKGIPYGAMRSFVGRQGDNVLERLESNQCEPVYIHSLDADAPDFETLKKKTSGGGWKKVLDAYDEILSEGPKAMVIGGYNLLAQPGEYESKDFEHTVRSNVVDLAIRQAIHSVAPLMTYPTEPNFLIRAGVYKKAREAKVNAWGEMAYEGRNLYDNVLKILLKENFDIGKEVEYDPLASVPTGVKGSGARLKIQTGKQYDEDSIYGKPQGSEKNVDEEIDLEEQYIVQAQSLAGASRLASAYIPAFKILNNRRAEEERLSVPPKKDLIGVFAPVEQLVLALLKNTELDDVVFVEPTTFDDSILPIKPIFNAVTKRLKIMQNMSEFNELVQ